jgi:hypothetical protein
MEKEIMLRRILLITLTCIGASGGLMTAIAAAPLTCPDAMGSTAANDPSALKTLYSGATDSTASNRLSELITASLRSGIKPLAIVNELVSGYCPLVAADPSLSDKQKVDRVRRFARQVTGLAYTPSDSDEVEVLVDIPVAPSVLNQVDQAASRAGMSRDAWIERAIGQQLANP